MWLRAVARESGIDHTSSSVCADLITAPKCVMVCQDDKSGRRPCLLVTSPTTSTCPPVPLSGPLTRALPPFRSPPTGGCVLLLLCCCCLWLCRGLERQLAEKTLGESPSSLRSRLAKLEVALAGKADAAEVRLQLERRPQRAEFSAAVAERASVAEVQHALDMKATQEEVDALARQVESLRGTLEAKADGADVRVQLAAKADVAEMTRRFASTASVGDLASRFEGLRLAL